MLWLGVALALPVSLLAIIGRFDGLYGQDPYAYYAYAIGPLRESLLALRLWPPPSFFWPPGYPLLVSGLSVIIGPTPLAGQLISLLAGALVPVFTAWLARELLPLTHRGNGVEGEGQVTASLPVVAGVLVALTPQLWQSSAVIMSDTVGLAAATLGAWALARYGRRRQGRWLVAASGAFAWALLTRWIYGLVAIPCAAYALIVWARGFSAQRSPSLVQGVAAAFVAVAILSPLLATRLTPGSSAFTGDLEVYTWSPLTAFLREHDTVDGRLSYSWPNGLYYALAPAHRYYLTPLLAVFVLPGVWVALRRRALGPGLLLVGWVASVYGFHAGAPWQNFRFTLAYLPPLAVLAALGLETFQHYLGSRWRWGVWLWMGAGLLSMAVGGAQLTQSFITRKADDLALMRAVEARMPPGARLLTFTLTLTFQHYSVVETLELFDVSPDALPALLADGRPTFLLLDVRQVETQWQGRALEASYHWLRDERGLMVLEQFDAYTLFQVTEP